MVSKKVSVSVSKIYGIEKSIGFKKIGIEKVSDSENTFEETRNHLKNIYIYQGVAMLVSENPEIISKISRGGGACFCQSGNPLKNIKGCLLEKRDDSLEVDDDD